MHDPLGKFGVPAAEARWPHDPAVLASFDVFDTVLTRRVGDPNVVFELLGRRLHEQGRIPVPPRVFAAARAECDAQLITSLRRHPTLVEIHDAVATALSVPEGAAADWVAAEEVLERELVVPLPGAVDEVAAARADHDGVVFVSDTPHRAELLRELLEREGLALPEDQVFTSGGTPYSKSRGGLFTEIASRLGDDVTFFHRGDHPRSDVAAARAEGWYAEHVGRGRLTRYEDLLESRSRDLDLVGSWLAGASRIARLEAVGRGVPAPVAQVSSGALGPLLVGYALWVAGQARARGVKRLYFVARDGEVMLAAARHVLAVVAPDLELRYLYGSRQPWIFGAAATSDTILERWVTVGRDFTVRTALARVQLTPEEAYAVTGDPLFDPSTADEALDAEGRRRIPELLTGPDYLERVRKNAETQAQETLAYLRQEGFFDGVPSALVDAGWKGHTAEAFDHLVQREGGLPVHHLLIGIVEAELDLRREAGVLMVPWLFDQQREHAPRTSFENPHVFVEMLCAGTTGRTLGYERDGDRMRPVLAEAVNERVIAWGLAEMQAVAVRVAELVAPVLHAEHVHLDLRSSVRDALRTLWLTPTPAEAEAWGSFPSEEETELPFAPVAQRLSTGDVVTRLRRGDGRIRRTNTWRVGSAMASNQPWRGLLLARAWQTRNRDRLQRIPRRARLEVAARRRTPAD